MRPIEMLVISASSRKAGNTAYLLDRALEEIDRLPFPVHVTRYGFTGKKFSACCGCLRCYTNGGSCIFKDDFEELRQLWLNADCVIYGTPVYHAGIPGQLKVFIDRLGNSLFGYYPVTSMRHMKAVGVIAQGGDFPGGQELCALDIMRHAALSDCVYVAPDGSYFGSGGWADGPDGKELKAKAERGAADMELTLQTAKSVVRRCADMAAILLAGAEALRPQLSQDPHYLELYTHAEGMAPADTEGQ